MSNILKIAAAGLEAAPAGYQIERSLRFNSADSAYLSRTPASTSNRKTWTWSGWVKRSKLASVQDLFTCFFGNNSRYGYLFFHSTDQLWWYSGEYTTGASATLNSSLLTTAVYRDLSSWYHILCVYDTTEATSTDRVKLFVNGTQVTTFSTASYPALNSESFVNSNLIHCIGVFGTTAVEFYNGYLADIHFVDGQALTPSDFGGNNSTTGVWEPLPYIGTYGTNGFYLPFSDNSGTTSATLGADSSGNGNNWTPNNFSVAAGAGNDSLVDTPTPYGTDTGAGGEVRGNYATFNPLSKIYSSDTFSEGNLKLVGGYAYATTRSTIGFVVGQGKFYAEITRTVYNSNNADYSVGIHDNAAGGTASTGGNHCFYYANGQKGINGTRTSYGATFGNNDVIGIAVDTDAETVTFYKNGVSQGAISYTFSGNVYFFATAGGGAFSSGDTVIGNFGQRPFAYTAPSGYKALCTTNLPDPTIADGGDYFNTLLWTGTGATNSITGVGFAPDFVWIKHRSGVRQHNLYDTVRGATKELFSDSTEVENTLAIGLTSFDSDGFTLGTGTRANESGQTFVGWNWNAGGSNATNTDGTITSTVRANPTAGFSIVSYTGTGSNATVGHGLGAAPKMLIVKNRSIVDGWIIGGDFLTSWAYFLQFDTDAQASGATLFNSTAPTSTVFSVGGATNTNGSGNNLIAYCFAEVENYSKFSTYLGNGSTDGPFVYCGFRPAFVLIKQSTAVGGTSSWSMFDNQRDPYNQNFRALFPDLSNAEGTGDNNHDFLSNGFKIRSGADRRLNASGGTYIFMAFAENPFKYSLAR